MASVAAGGLTEALRDLLCRRRAAEGPNVPRLCPSCVSTYAEMLVTWAICGYDAERREGLASAGRVAACTTLLAALRGGSHTSASTHTATAIDSVDSHGTGAVDVPPSSVVRMVDEAVDDGGECELCRTPLNAQESQLDGAHAAMCGAVARAVADPTPGALTASALALEGDELARNVLLVLSAVATTAPGLDSAQAALTALLELCDSANDSAALDGDPRTARAIGCGTVAALAAAQPEALVTREATPSGERLQPLPLLLPSMARTLHESRQGGADRLAALRAWTACASDVELASTLAPAAADGGHLEVVAAVFADGSPAECAAATRVLLGFTNTASARDAVVPLVLALLQFGGLRSVEATEGDAEQSSSDATVEEQQLREKALVDLLYEVAFRSGDDLTAVLDAGGVAAVGSSVCSVSLGTPALRSAVRLLRVLLSAAHSGPGGQRDDMPEGLTQRLAAVWTDDTARDVLECLEVLMRHPAADTAAPAVTAVLDRAVDENEAARALVRATTEQGPCARALRALLRDGGAEARLLDASAAAAARGDDALAAQAAAASAALQRRRRCPRFCCSC